VGLAETRVTRRATMLDTGEGITDAEPDECMVAPAVVDRRPRRSGGGAGLVRHYAARHGLWQLDPTSPTCPAIDFPTTCADSRSSRRLNYSERRLRQALSARDIGAVEILIRGIGVDPDALRARLRLRGSQPVSVVIARIGSGAASRATAFICHSSR
jgi:hypothetical protein